MGLLEIYFAFTLGLVGSLHCVQMCGPIVLSYSLPLASHSRGRQMAAHLAYNLGRITTYAALGAVAGSAGAAVGLMGRLAGIEHVAAMVAGSLMIVAGIFMSGLIPRGQLARLFSFRPASLIAKAIGRPMQSPTAGAKFTMGLMLGFLPCGLVYAALLKAMETAAPLAGAVTLLAFGLGTVGALLLMGAFSTTIGLWFRHRSNQLAALGVTLMGGFLLYRGIMASMHQAHMHH